MSDPIVVGSGREQVKIVPGFFRSSISFHKEFAKIVVVDCSDGRFTPTDGEFIGRIFAGGCSPDELKIPGGSAALSMSSAAVAQYISAKESLIFLVKGHNLGVVVLLAHEDCGHYKHKNPGRSPEEIRLIQLRDLRDALKTVSDMLPSHVVVRAFFKRLEKDSVVFDEVLPT